MRAAPWLVALVALLVYLAATERHGVGISLDSVVYARAAQSMVERGTLDVPLTRWDVTATHVPLSHFPPGLSLALAAVSRGLGTDPFTAWRWLNAVCLVATVAGVARMAAGSGFALSIVLALMLGPAFVTMYLWAWSEPLFLLLVVAVVHCAIRSVRAEARPRDAAWLGIGCGLATLIRYAGISLFAGSALTLLFSRLPVAAKAKQSMWLGGAYAIVTLPWAWWLATSAGAPRDLGFYTDHVLGQVVRPILRTVASWFLPTSLPLPVSLAILALVSVAVVTACVRRARANDHVRVGPLAIVATTLLVVHVAFLVVTRVVADSGMPFDVRILAAAMLLSALALSDLGRALFPTRPPKLAILLVACVAVSGLRASVPQLTYSATRGLGYVDYAWRNSETIAWLAKLPPEATIFSNAPDAIAAYLPVTAKYTPEGSDADRLAEFVARVTQAAPAVVVLFADPHAGWLLPRDRLLALPGATPVAKFSDSVVVSWHGSVEQ